MPQSMSMDFQQKPMQSLKQLQRLIMTRQMQQAINLLQMPVMELSPIVEMELQQNPVLECLEEGEEELDENEENQQLEEEVEEEALDEDRPSEKELKFDEHDFEIMRRLDEDFRDYFAESGTYTVRRTSEEDKLQTFLENSIIAETTLFEHLMHQAQESFEDKQQLPLAEAIIGNLDHNGFLTTPLQEIATMQKSSLEKVEKVLAIIQTFHPSGVGARDLRESLLIQLRALGAQETLAYRIIEKHFDDLLHNRIPAIKKGLHCTSEQIDEMVDHYIAKLDLHPGGRLSQLPTAFITPDVTINQDGESLTVSINEDSMPRLRLNTRYMRMLDDETLPQETKEFIRHKVVSAKWLLRNILQRNDTLERIANALAKGQREFFINPQGKLVPLTMKELALELDVHESTIARAVANKYVETPRGLLPLRFFFTNALLTQEGDEISSKTVREMLQDIIEKEDKHHPLSDEGISSKMKAQGITCARRTVAKYRSILSIGSAQQRRKF